MVEIIFALAIFLRWDAVPEAETEPIMYEVLVSPDMLTWEKCAETPNTTLTFREYEECVNVGKWICIKARNEQGLVSKQCSNIVEYEVACLRMDCKKTNVLTCTQCYCEPETQCEERCYPTAGLKLTEKYEECDK